MPDYSVFPHPWMPDCGDGTYRNPVLHADYSDPDVIRVGGEFWMTASSFTATPGLPLLRSVDLVNWELVGHALRQVPDPSYAAVRAGSGVWAPSLREHGGRFWIFFPMPDEGIFVTSAPHPSGPWSEPWLLQAARGWIDPCPFWDDDGSAWLFHAYANSRAGKRDRLHARPMSPDCTQLLGEGFEVAYAPHHPYLEGPKVHKRDGWYYVMAPGGGVQTGWQVAYRSRSITGPYEERVVLEQGSTPVNGPHQGAFIDDPDGRWWFVHFQDKGAYGRVTHLQPVHWPHGDEWPRVGVDYDGNGVGEPVAGAENPLLRPGGRSRAPATSDLFPSGRPGVQWQWNANHDPAWVERAAAPARLRLRALPADRARLDLAPHLLMQKFPAESFSFDTTLDTAACELAGVIVVGGGRFCALVLERAAAGLRMLRMDPEGCIAVAPLATPACHLRVRVDSGALCRFEFRTAMGGWLPAGDPFVAREGGWMGARVGLLACGREGHAEFGPVTFT